MRQNRNPGSVSGEREKRGMKSYDTIYVLQSYYLRVAIILSTRCNHRDPDRLSSTA